MGTRSSAQGIARGWRGESEQGPAARKIESDSRYSAAAAAVGAGEDVVFMRRALALAEQHRGRTAPNPIVGCVIVDAGGHVIAEGAHRGPGQPHAEVDALAHLAAPTIGTVVRKVRRAAGATTAHAFDGVAKGASMYVNLEPCMHHGRTPPCAPAVIASGVTRVVIGSEDPVPGHGGGIEALREAGIVVERALVDECDAANRPFFTWAREQRPAFTLKAAVTLDGKIATVAGQSRWITGDAARADGRRLRDTHDAILVGIGTVIADDPELTARLPGARDPIRIILDSTLRIPTSARVLRGGGGRTIIATTVDAPVAKERKLVKLGAVVWRLGDAATKNPGAGSASSSSAKMKRAVGAGRGARANSAANDESDAARGAPNANSRRVPLDALAKRLAAEGITSVVVEGGGAVHAAFLAADLADELCIYVAPKIVGGPAPSWVGGDGIRELDLAHRFSFVDAVAIDGDMRLRAVRLR